MNDVIEVPIRDSESFVFPDIVVEDTGEIIDRDWLEKKSQEYSTLKINGVEDKEGYSRVKSAAKIFAQLRIAVERRRKELKEKYLKAGREVDSEAEKIQKVIAPYENALSVQVKAIDTENKRLKTMEDNRPHLPVRRSTVDSLSLQYSDEDLLLMPQDTYRDIIEQAQQKKIAEMQVALEAEAKAKTDAELAAAHERQIEYAKFEAAENARIAEQKRIANDAMRVELAAKEAQARQQAELRQKGEREQIRHYAAQLMAIQAPDLIEYKSEIENIKNIIRKWL